MAIEEASASGVIFSERPDITLTVKLEKHHIDESFRTSTKRLSDERLNQPNLKRAASDGLARPKYP